MKLLRLLRDSHYYLLFWSFQFLAVLNNAMHIWYMDDLLAIAVGIPTIPFIYSAIIVLAYYYNHKKKFPFTKSPCFCFSDTNCHIFWRIIVNVFAVGNPFVFFCLHGLHSSMDCIRILLVPNKDFSRNKCHSYCCLVYYWYFFCHYTIL